MSFTENLEKLKDLLRVIPDDGNLPLTEDPRVVVKAIREILELLPSIIEEVDHLVFERATLNREMKHRSTFGKNKYYAGMVDAAKMVSETEATSPTSRDVLNELIGRLEEKINNL